MPAEPYEYVGLPSVTLVSVGTVSTFMANESTWLSAYNSEKSGSTYRFDYMTQVKFFYSYERTDLI